MTCPLSPNGSHVLLCGTGTPKGTPATCRLCGASIHIPPARVHNGKWTAGAARTLPGMTVPMKRRFEDELDMGHASVLAEEGKKGARE